MSAVRRKFWLDGVIHDIVGFGRIFGLGCACAAGLQCQPSQESALREAISEALLVGCDLIGMFRFFSVH